MDNEKLKKIHSELTEIDTKIRELKKEKINIVEGIKKDIKSWYKKWLRYIFGGFSLLGIITVITLYCTVMKKSEEFITQSITQKFDEPQINNTLNEVANHQAKAIIEEKLNPAIQEANISVNNEIESFRIKLNEFKEEYDSELKKTAKEVEYLKNRNNILKLGDEAITTGNAAPYDELLNVFKASTNDDIKMIVFSEILRVNINFGTMTRVGNLDIKHLPSRTGKILLTNKIPTEVLIEFLQTRENWKERAVIVRNLGRRKEKKVPEALLDVIKSDKILDVRRLAINSFQSVTGFRSSSVFGYPDAEIWWESNKGSVEKDLKDLQTVEKTLN